MTNSTLASTITRAAVHSENYPQWLRKTPILLLIFQPVIFFRHVLINPDSHIPFDIEGFHLPLISYVAQSVRHGIAPLWDPLFYAGVPIHADSQAQVFYPFTWLAILAGNHSQGKNLFYWVEVLGPLHMALAGLFTFWLLRRMDLRLPAALLGATVYQIGAFFASQAQHLAAICCAAWLPLTILAIFEVRRHVRARWVAVLALSTAMTVLAGFMPTTLAVGMAALLMLGALVASREASWRLFPAVAVGFLIGIVISTVELIPLWHLTQASIASLRANWYLRGGGLPIQSLVSFVLPNYYHIFEPTNGYKLPFNYTFLYIYCGTATALLLALAPFLGRTRERIFLSVTILCAIWMLGEHTPIYHSIYVHLPGLLRSSLYAEYALMVFCFFTGITAALVLHRMRKYLPDLALWAIALFTSYDLIHTGSDRPMNQMRGSYRQSDSKNQIAGSKDLANKLHELVNQTVPPSRIDYLDNVLWPPEVGANLVGLPTADGDNPFMFRRMLYLRRIFCGGNWWERRLPVNRPDSPLLSMLNVRWLSAASPLSSDEIGAAGLQALGSVGGKWIYRNPRVLPRFYLVRRIRSSPNEAATFRMLAEHRFDPWEEAVVENIAGDRSNLATEPVTVQAYEPNRVVLSVVTSGTAFLASSEVLYDGWRAKVNGKPEPLLMTNGAFRGLALAVGANEIVMEYHPPLLGIYLLFSCVVAILAIAVVVRDQAFWQTKTVLGNRPRLSWVTLVRPANLSPKCLIGWLTELRRQHLTASWLALFLPVVYLFYWKILLTRQFSLLTDSEGVNQAYSWLRFWISSIRHGIMPLWDPYTFSGHIFVGEMQTGAFYPLHILLAIVPFNRNYMLSPYLYHAWWAGTHLLGASFMFLLAREIGLSRYSGFVSGICFSLGGFVGRMPWPHMLESSIWLPLIFLFFLRAVHVGGARRLASYASLGGLTLGMSILAGGLHVVIMQLLVLVSAAIFFAIVSDSGAQEKSQPWMKAGRALGIFVTIGFAASAIQLLPSIEYSHHAIRFLGSAGALPADEKIPYGYMSDALAPHGIAAMLLPFAFNGNTGSGEVINPYLGVFTLLAAVIGVRRNWCCVWVRYLSGLAVLAFLYSFGPFSWLHGVLYATIPKLWVAREAPRMIYLADFSLALLAGFGIETVFSRAAGASWIGLNRILLVLVSACALCLFVPAVFGRPEISPWVSLSLLLIIASYGLFRYILSGHLGTSARVVLIILTLFDLGAFDWTAQNVIMVTKGGVNHMDHNLSLRGAADFLKTRPGRFRVEVMGDSRANIGDLFGIESVNGAAVTLPSSYTQVMKDRDLLGVRYLVKPASAQDPGPIFQDSTWKVYENPNAFPRAWIVHQVIREVSGKESPVFDPSRTAIVDGEIKGLEPAGIGAEEAATLSKYQPNSLEVRAHAQARGLLVLSETYYPGWHATVNGAPADIIKVDRDLRAVVVPAGDSHVVLDYRPWSVYAGAALSLLTFIAIPYYSISNLRLRKSQSRI